jgi:hypothetical protein
VKRKTILILLLAAAFALLILLWPLARNGQRTVKSPQRDTAAVTVSRTATAPNTHVDKDSSLPESKAKRRIAIVEGIQNALATPIIFYGKIIDQHGAAISDATISYGTLDRFDAPGSKYEGKSDKNGNFSITDIKGAALRVGVRKAGYYAVPGKSSNAFAYGIGVDSNLQSPPTKEEPAIFMLQKMGVADPLIKVSHTYRISKSGAPIEVDLTSGNKTTHGDIRVETWTQDETPDQRGHYDWRCRVSVPDGCLIQRSGQFDFEAPIEGYRDYDELVMSQTADDWQAQARREYFFKFNDGRYARIRFEIFAGGDHFFEVEPYVNPKPGSRNLEYDPNKRITE